VKVLFIGEGRHDIGESDNNPQLPRAARGTVPTLARRACGAIDKESIAVAWREIHRFNPTAKKRGYPAKISAAVLISIRKFHCEGTIFVADRDGDRDRQSELEKGTENTSQLFPQHPTAWGLAVESVEAWTLGAQVEIAQELGVSVDLVLRQYPAGIHVEELSDRSGKPDHQPKKILERIAQIKHSEDCLEFRESIAIRTDVAALAKACPQGFAPFLQRLRKVFGPVPDSPMLPPSSGKPQRS
jgi:hypothetical protein